MQQSSYRDLQRRAKGLGLKASGTKDLLYQRVFAEEQKRLRSRLTDDYLLGLPRELVLNEVTKYLDGRSLLSLAVVNSNQRAEMSKVDLWIDISANYGYRKMQQLIIAWAKASVLLEVFLEFIADPRITSRIETDTLINAYLLLLEREKNLCAQKLKAMIVSLPDIKIHPLYAYVRLTSKTMTDLKKTLGVIKQLQTKSRGGIKDEHARLQSALRLGTVRGLHGERYLWSLYVSSLTDAQIRVRIDAERSVDNKIDLAFYRFMHALMEEGRVRINRNNASWIDGIDNDANDHIRRLVRNLCDETLYLHPEATSAQKTLYANDGGLSRLPPRNYPLAIRYVKWMMKSHNDRIAAYTAQMVALPGFAMQQIQQASFYGMLYQYIDGITLYYEPWQVIEMARPLEQKDRDTFLRATESYAKTIHAQVWLGELNRLVSELTPVTQ